MSNTYQALNIPPAATERGGFEVLRCAIVDGELHLTLRPVFNEPNDWGRLFAATHRTFMVYPHLDCTGRFPPIGSTRNGGWIAIGFPLLWAANRRLFPLWSRKSQYRTK